LAHFHNILEMNIKMQQQLFHWLRNAKQLNIRNLTEVNGIHETKQEKNYETKRNFTSDETKRNKISLFLLFRETSKISRNKFFVSLCFVFRETKKRMRNGNHKYVFLMACPVIHIYICTLCLTIKLCSCCNSFTLKLIHTSQ
jgi:fumarate reductase subunit C